ncbi:MAG TPA: VOC family protein [Candidatus Polarisedimenticolia bacterium]|nr:VOC family protein [Candidatus Polarisedimenticolia bacterium]
MRLTRLDHLALYVSDLSVAERFYTDVLGMKLVSRLGEMTLVECAGLNIGLVRRPELAPRDPGVIRDPLARAHHAFLVDAADLGRWRAALEAAGAPTHGPVSWGDHECFYFLDPDGNLLEIVTPPGSPVSAAPEAAG